MRKLYNISFLLLLVCAALAARAQRTGMKGRTYNDTLTDEKYLAQFTRYQRYLPFINYNENYVQWGDVSAVDNFFNKLAKANRKKVTVLHIGDSHVQADFFTGYIRENIQKVFGYGGRGFIFPYACAGTHSTYDYRTWKYGQWEGARNVKNPDFRDIGIAGAVAYTTDNDAGFKFGFKENILMPTFTRLKIFCKKDSQSFDLKIKLNGYDDTIFVKTYVDTALPYVLVNLPLITDTFAVFMNQTDSLQNFFECYGLSVESNNDRGILYHSVGINGAGYKSILSQTLTVPQMQEIDPDLVIIDLGANDFYGCAFKHDELCLNLAGVISLIKEASPNASIMVSCSQDIYRKRRNVGTAYNFSLLTAQQAKLKGTAWYNYYNVAGGRYSMLKWRRNQLAKSDKVHLTTAGYHIKGDLYMNALLNSYREYLKHHPKQFEVGNGVPGKLDDSAFVSRQSADPDDDTTKQKLIHKVKKGEKLKTIARKYKVDEEDIMDWNGLESTYLRTGTQLVIYVDKKEIITQNIKEEPATPSEAHKVPKKAPTTTVKYKVQRGDTLSQIARKYGVSVAQIKKLNNLHSDFIREGQILRIK